MNGFRSVWMTPIGALMALIGACSDYSVSPLDLSGASHARTTGSGSSGGGKEPSVTSVDPSYGQQGEILDVIIYGSGFDETSQATWERDGLADPTNVQTNHTTYVSSSELLANITIASSADLDLYDVSVTSYGGKKKGIGIEMFEVTRAIVIGSLDGNTAARAINASEQVVGWSYVGSDQHAFYWSSTSGMVDLGVGSARGIDEAGTTVVGHSGGYATIWNLTSTGWIRATLPHQGAGGLAAAVASDTSTGGAAHLIVGRDNADGSQSPRPAYWAYEAGAWSTSYLLPTPSSASGWADAVTPDGRVIVGRIQESRSRTYGSVWERDPDGAYHYTILAPLTGDASAAAFGVSADGTVVVGESQDRNGNVHPVYWTRSGDSWAPAGLPSVEGSGIGRANAISGNGARIAGESDGHPAFWELGANSATVVKLGSLGSTGSARGVPFAITPNGSVLAGRAGTNNETLGVIWRP